MKKLKDQIVGMDARFHYRGLNQTRIETFSDAVFAFAVTLVVLSSSVPENFSELMLSFRQIIPFLACVTLIVVIWFQHYVFFIRYGLQDKKTVIINAFLLFVLLIYVYPLKFLMTFLFELYYGLITKDMTYYLNKYDGQMNMSVVMTAYGFGAAIIFMTMAWLYRHAHRRARSLDMDSYEIFVTKVSIWVNLLLSCIPFFSAMISLLHPFGHGRLNFIIAGFSYMLYPPVMIIFGRVMSRKGKRLFPV